MSHVDEGTLHAYLDGELPSAERATLEHHFVTCAACRGLLAEERALLERASALLGSARPVERPAPPFEQVRRTPKRSPWRVRTSLAWAASIVFALGLGYAIRGSNDVLAPSTVADHQRMTAEDKAQVPTPAAAAPPEQQRQEKAGRRFNARPAAPSLARAPESTSVDELRRGDTAAFVSGVVALEPTVHLRGASPALRQREADSLALAERLRSDRALEEAPVPAAAASGVVSLQAQRGETVKVDGAPARPDSRSVRNLVSTTWPLISQGAATSMLGERPLGVPGLATRRIRRSPGPDSTVVVEQALDAKTVIQIFQRPASTAADSGMAGYMLGAERERADRMLARYVGRLRVEISGPVSTDSLNKLLEQVEPLP